ncbi:hypothetical protein Zmor_010423 [Zophobas morio]|uniref:DDE Tnp4 domain-containing protein n=1 Tax=Zophobas morio TaxID=2755281 RepID=A0AA38INN4_9CUCU|nr:hypothetical protein Zmor_010423 [Zophobas morio]
MYMSIYILYDESIYVFSRRVPVDGLLVTLVRHSFVQEGGDESIWGWYRTPDESRAAENFGWRAVMNNFGGGIEHPTRAEQPRTPGGTTQQRCVGQDCFVNLFQTKIFLAITEVAAAIETHLDDFNGFPNPEDHAAIKTKFMERYNVPGVIGFVDGTHIAITNPRLNIEHQYLNRKGFDSKNVCGPNNKIFRINAAHGGANHDAFIWWQSNIAQILEQRFTGGDRTSWLLGDSRYQLQPYLITPVRNPADDTPEHRLNIAHRSARSCVERCIGILKARFRCLIQERVLKYAPVKAGSIINACAILHNFMVARNLPLPPEHEILKHMDDPGDNDDDDLVSEQPPNEARMINIALKTRNVNIVEQKEESTVYRDEVLEIAEVQQEQEREWTAKVELEETMVEVKMDTGAMVNTLPVKLFKVLCKNNPEVARKLKPIKRRLETYGGFKLESVVLWRNHHAYYRNGVLNEDGDGVYSVEASKNEYLVKCSVVIDEESLKTLYGELWPDLTTLVAFLSENRRGDLKLVKTLLKI